MDENLWSKLETMSDHDWLEQVSFSATNQVTIKRNCSFRLYKLTQIKLERIAALPKSTTEGLNIIVAESDPIEFLAAFLAGIISKVNLFLGNPNWQASEWQQVIDLVTPDLLFAAPPVTNLIKNLNANPKPTIDSDLKQQSWIAIPTGGSSGKIKFALHNWSSLTASVWGFKTYFDCPQINSFCILPLYHVSGLMQFIRSFISQGNLILCPYRVLKTQKLDCDRQDWFISLVPTQLQLLIELIPDWLAEFKTILLGGAPPSPELLEQARRYRLPLAPTYGMTETASQIVTLKPQDFLAGNNSSGRVLPHAQIKIQPQTSQNSKSKIGLIQISSTSLGFGYYPQIFAQKDQSQPNLFTTDDLGYFDDAGYLHVVGRNSQKIITGGENVFPREVEAVILATKLVTDVCVVGISNRQWGEVVTAVYVPIKPGLSVQAIRDRLQYSLAKYKQPKHWIEVDSLERNDRGKIDYLKIRAIALSKVRNKN